MAKFMNVAIAVIVAAAAILQIADAANYTVGGSTGWISEPSGGASFYSNWAKNFTFKVDDVLVFTFTTGRHAVFEITKANFDACNLTENLQVWSTGPARVTLNRTGDFYFACPFTGHCSSGQQLSVSVSSGSSAAPSPSSPTTPGATAPPPQGSAMSLAAATFSSLLMTIGVNLLF